MSDVGGEWFSAGELAAKTLPGLPSTKPGILKRAKEEGWDQRSGAAGPLARKRKGRGGGVEYHVSLLPEVTRVALLGGAAKPVAERVDRDTAWAEWERLPEGLKAEARRRAGVLAEIDALMRQGLGKAAAVNVVVKLQAQEAKLSGAKPTSTSTVYAWSAQVSGVAVEDREAYLVPAYAGRKAAVEISTDAWEFYKGDYLRLSKPAHASCYRNLQRAAAEHGWAVPANPKALIRRLDAEIPPAIQTYLREGDSALSHAFPHLQRDRSSIAPMQVLNLDGHTWDVMVRWPEGRISRALALAVQDIASGKILSIRFDLTLNHHLVRLALGDAFRDYGLCDTLIMDNGRENAAKAISGGLHRLRWGKTPEEEPAGLLKTLGVKAVFATPYWGQAKPIERAFRNFAHDVAKRAEFEGAYTGHNPVAKPENYGSRAIPFAEFEAIVRREIAHYNAQLGRTGQGMNGRSFDQVFEAGLERRPMRKLVEPQLRLCMLASKKVSMDQASGAVTIEGHRYWSPELAAVKRQSVTVRFDPERMDLKAYVYSLDGRLLAEADRLQAGSFDNPAQAREHTAARRDFKRGQKLQAAALRTLTAADVAARVASVPDPEPIQTDANVVALVPKAPRKVADLGGAQSHHLDAWGRGIRQAVSGE